MGSGRRLVSAQTPVLLCSDWEDLALVVVGVLWQRDLEQDQMEKHCGIRIFMWVLGALSITQENS